MIHCGDPIQYANINTSLLAAAFYVLWKAALIIKKKEGENLNRKIKKYLDEIEKTEKKIADLEMYLKGVRSALKEEENNEMIKSIRGMKLKGQELFDLLNGIQDGTISFVASGESEEESGSFVVQEEKERK
ncbi:MAG: DUF4315 family protein [Dorea sp.]